MLCGQTYAPIRESITALWLRPGSYLKKIRIFLTNPLLSSWWGSCGQQVVETPEKCEFVHSLQLLAEVLEITNSEYLLEQSLIKRHDYLSQLRQHWGKLSHFPQFKKSLGCCGDTALQVHPDLGSAKTCAVSLTNKKRCQNTSELSGVTISLLHLSFVQCRHPFSFPMCFNIIHRWSTKV